MVRVQFIFAIFLSIPAAYGQNLFDEENTRKYAEYLYQRGKFALAIPEYERLIYFNPDSEVYQAQLLESYFNIEAYDKIAQTIPVWYPDSIRYPISLYLLKTTLKTGTYQEAYNILDNETRYQFPSEQVPVLRMVTYGLASDWKKAAGLCNNTPPIDQEADFARYCQIVTSAAEFKPKNKLLAAGLSTLVPGLGKVYTRDYIDAAVNFLFIGVTAFQAYRGFSNDNINDLQGWIYGGVALSFYLGNIYGSWRAADQYNYRFYEDKRQELDRSFFSGQPLE